MTRLLPPSFILFATLFSCAANPSSFDVIEEEIIFESNGLDFSGVLYLPDANEPAPLLIMYHAASGGSINFPFYQHLKTDLPQRGVSVFVYNRRGTSGQPGNFNTASFSDLADDGIAAASVLKDDPRIEKTKIGAWGISQGGWVAPVAANRSDLISFAISVSGPGVSPANQMAFTSTYHLREQGYDADVIATAMMLREAVNSYFRGETGQIETQALIDEHRSEPWFSLVFLPNGGNMPADVTQSKWYYEMDFNPTEAISKMTDPFMIVFGAKDRWVPVEESVAAIRAAYPDPSKLGVFVSEQSGHLMSGQDESSAYAGNLSVESEYLDSIIAWIADLPDSAD